MTASRTLFIEPLTREAYAPFGQVIETEGAHHYPINGGMTERYHDLAKVELGGVHPRPLVSIARGQPYALPLTLKMVERHPLGSQAFYPLSQRPFLSIVAPDEGGIPGRPRAFLAGPGQGINMAMNTWHAVLTPLGETSDFLIIDRGGEGNNLEEYFFDEPYLVVEPD
ncbi:ureidoglycolate lyase [Devosia sp. A16]|uniref:ureidoglycolate lyase n=1 Tax=Devosia sp. A16 TaxID=1736675 RepID=UPI0006D76B00|nr:ureidoglycolate lyase [Devosia sp. A16]